MIKIQSWIRDPKIPGGRAALFILVSFFAYWPLKTYWLNMKKRGAAIRESWSGDSWNSLYEDKKSVPSSTSSHSLPYPEKKHNGP